MKTTLAKPGETPVKVLAALTFVFCAYLVAAGQPALGVGDTFPSLSHFTFEGDPLPELKGKIVLVDFWASWCAPCKETFPLLEQLHHRFSKKGLVILAVNEDKSRMAMAEFLKEYPVTFPVVRDSGKKLVAKVNVPGLPTSYILDPNGKVLAIERGSRIAQNRKEFIARVEQFLENNEKAP